MLGAASRDGQIRANHRDFSHTFIFILFTIKDSAEGEERSTNEGAPLCMVSAGPSHPHSRAAISRPLALINPSETLFIPSAIIVCIHQIKHNELDPFRLLRMIHLILAKLKG